MPKFSRQHYIALANAIRGAYSRDTVIAEIVSTLAADNPRFDPGVFARACTPERVQADIIVGS